MLNKDEQKKLLKALKYSDEDIKTLVDDEKEQTVTIPTTTKVFTDEEFETVKNNLAKPAQKAGGEFAIKELKTKAGLDYDGKDADKFLEEYKKHILAEAKVSESDKEKTWQTEKAALQKALSDKEAAISAIQLEKDGLLTDTKLMKLFPKDRDSKFTDDQWLTLLKSEIKIEKDGDKEVVMHKGSKLQDDKFNDLPLDKAIDHIFTANKWKVEEQQQQAKGRGFDSSKQGQGTVNNMKEFREYAESKGIKSLNGSEAKKLLSEVMKSNPQFVTTEQ